MTTPPGAPTQGVGDLDEAHAAALLMVDKLPLHALLDLQKTMAVTIGEYAAMGVGIPPRNVKLKAKVESRITELSKAKP